MLFALFGLVLLMCILFRSGGSDPNRLPPGDPGYVVPRLRVNGQIYGPTDRTDDLWVRDGFERIGEIKEKVEIVNHSFEWTADFQAYGLAEGLEVYGHSDFPEVVYVMEGDRSSVFALGNPNGDLLNYDGVVYKSLGSMDVGEFKEMEARYGTLKVVAKRIQRDAVYRGETAFVGYGRWPRKELDSNYFQEPVSVYRDGDNPDILYVGKRDNPDVLYDDSQEKIFRYVPVQNQPNLDTN